jgi:hypothetical protein
MSILEIVTIHKSDIDDSVYVSAVVEDSVIVCSQTYHDPTEYGPATCESHFYLGDDTLPEDDDKLIKYLESLDLEWKVLDNSDDDIDW